MTKEELNIVYLLREKAWRRYKPNVPFQLESVDWMDFAVDISAETSYQISYKSIKRFFYLDLNNSIHKNRSKGIIAMYAMSVKNLGLSYRQIDNYYTRFLKEASVMKNEDVHNAKNQSFLKNVIGTYESYIVTNQNRNIRKSIFLITKNGEVKCKSATQVEYTGEIIIKTFGRIIILNLEIPNTNYFFQTILQGSYDYENKILYGIYSGVSVHNNPIGGRELLVKVGNENEYSKFTPDLIKISSNRFKELCEKLPELIDFFLGKKDNFIETTETLKSLKNKDS